MQLSSYYWPGITHNANKLQTTSVSVTHNIETTTHGFSVEQSRDVTRIEGLGGWTLGGFRMKLVGMASAEAGLHNGAISSLFTSSITSSSVNIQNERVTAATKKVLKHQ